MKNHGDTAPIYAGLPASELTPFRPLIYCVSVSVDPTNLESVSTIVPMADLTLENKLAPTELRSLLADWVVREIGQPELNYRTQLRRS